MSLHVEITDTEVLKKTIEILSCIIQGHSIRGVLRNNTKFFVKETKVDFMVLYMNKGEGNQIDYISSNKGLFLRLFKKYNFTKYSPSFVEIGNKILDTFSYARPYLVVSNLYQIMKGTITKTECKQMMDEIKFSTAVFFPIQCKQGKKIGFISYYYIEKKVPDIEKLKQVSALIQAVIEPLYNYETSTFYSKCSQLDTDMSRLTSKEREITQRVIKGTSYKEIAQELNISVNTLKTHMKNIFSKYGVNSKLKLTNELSKH